MQSPTTNSDDISTPLYSASLPPSSSLFPSSISSSSFSSGFSSPFSPSHSITSINTSLRSGSNNVRHLHGDDSTREEALTKYLDDLIEAAESRSDGQLGGGVEELDGLERVSMEERDQSEIGDEDHPTGPQELPPLVIVEGFFSFFHRRLWGEFDKYLNAYRNSLGRKEHRKFILARVGPVSSMHDRACELFYSIKGGTVDYGYVHAKSSFHSRYGRHYQTGSYPSWSRSNPIHFVTHSLGGTTVTVMQQLINEGHFGFENGIHPDMVASVTAVSAPFKGTGFAYIIGEDRKCAPEIEYFSVNSFIVRSVHTLSYFAPLIPSWIPLPDWHRDARRMTMTEISFWEYLKQMWRSDWGERKDVISFDATYEGPVEWERFWNGSRGKGVKGKEESRTYYRSYVACMTQRASPETTRHVCSWKSNILESIFIYLSAHLLGDFDYGSIRPVPWFMKPRSRSSCAGVVKARSCGNSGPGNSRELGRSEVEEEEEGTMFGCGVLDGNEACVRERDLEGGVGRKNWHGRTGTKVELSEDYYANDGVVPLFSQFHPGDCSPSHCIHHSSIQNPHPNPFYFGTPTSPPLSSPFVPGTQAAAAMPKSKPKPGIWNVCYMPDTTHLSLMPLWRGTRMQKEFWTELGEWLEVVDEARMESDVEGKASEKVGGKRAPVVPVRSFSRPL